MVLLKGHISAHGATEPEKALKRQEISVLCGVSISWGETGGHESKREAMRGWGQGPHGSFLYLLNFVVNLTSSKKN